MSTVETNLVQPSTGTTLTLGAASDTIDIPSGATLDVTGATVTGLSAGKVLQVVSSMMEGTASTTSNTMVTTGLEGTITPSSSSNKVLIFTSFAQSATGDAGCWVQLFKGSSVISGSLGDVQGSRLQGSVGVSYSGNQSYAFSYLDSPSTTSATTYKLMYAVSPGRPGGSTIYMNTMTTGDTAYYSTSPATMILMEIEG